MENLFNKIITLLSVLIDYFGGNEPKTKYQTITVTLPIGTIAGRYTEAQELDTDFTVCDGVQVKEITSGGVPFYNVGLEDKNNTYQSVSHKDDFISSTSVDPDKRYKRISIPVISGQKLEIKTEFDTVLASELKYQMILRLRKIKK